MVVATAGYYAYRTGTRLSEVKIESLEAQIAVMSAKAGALDRANEMDQRDLAVARALAEDWQRRYERDVATGDDKILIDALRRKLADGISHDRLEFIIGAAEERRECEDAPATKRFIVTTPLHRGDRASAVGYNNGEIVVSAAGASMRDADGNPEAWFDPAQPVTVNLVTLSGQSIEETGVLPLYPSVILGEAEYRLSVLAELHPVSVDTTLSNRNSEEQRDGQRDYRSGCGGWGCGQRGRAAVVHAVPSPE